jgi:putative FmdB family regulatory protein
MPLFDYQCRTCNVTVEALAPADGRKALRHEVCGAKLWRLFSPPAVIFKGEGFAKNDRRGKNGKGI